MTDSQDLWSLPESLDGVREHLPKGTVISNRIIEPLLRIEKHAGELSVKLYAVMNVKAERRLLPAISLKHNWVADNKVIRPLPGDIPAVIKSLLADFKANLLSFPDVLALMRSPQDEIAVEVDNEVLSCYCGMQRNSGLSFLLRALMQAFIHIRLLE